MQNFEVTYKLMYYNDDTIIKYTEIISAENADSVIAHIHWKYGKENEIGVIIESLKSLINNEFINLDYF